MSVARSFSVLTACLVLGALITSLFCKPVTAEPLPAGAIVRCGEMIPLWQTNFTTVGALSADGRVVAVAERRRFRLLDVATGKEVRSLPVDWPLLSVEFSPNGKLLVTADGVRGVCVWDVGTGKLLRRLAERFAPQLLRPLRALEILERLDSTESRALLARLAAGRPGALFTRQAKQALERLTRR